MAEVINIIGQKDVVFHKEDTDFTITFSVADEATGAAFSLTDYNGEFKIVNNEIERQELYKKTTTEESPKLTFTSNTFKIEDKIAISRYGQFYFELRISHKTIANKVYVIWFGIWDNA